MPNETNIWLKNKGTRDFLENVALAWAAKYPRRAAVYKQVLKEDQNGLVNPSGMSRNGSFQFKGAIPADVFAVIERKYPGFFQVAKNMRIFQEIFMGKLAPSEHLKHTQKFFY